MQSLTKAVHTGSRCGCHPPEHEERARADELPVDVALIEDGDVSGDGLRPLFVVEAVRPVGVVERCADRAVRREEEHAVQAIPPSGGDTWPWTSNTAWSRHIGTPSSLDSLLAHHHARANPMRAQAYLGD